MFIPGWLLFIGVVIAIAASKRLSEAVGATLYGSVIFGIFLLLLASLGASIYCLVTQQYAIGILVGSPIIALGIARAVAPAKSAIVLARERSASLIGSDGRLKLKTLRSRLKAHERKVARAKGPAAIIEARLAFAHDVAVGETLFAFWRDIIADEDAPRWSSIVTNDSIADVAVRELEWISLPDTALGDYDSCRVYRFSSSGRTYGFYTRLIGSLVPGLPPDIPGSGLHPLQVYVVALPSTVVFEALLLIEHRHFNYREARIERFHPEEWLVALMSAADRAQHEYRTRLKAEEQDRVREQARRFVA